MGSENGGLWRRFLCAIGSHEDVMGIGAAGSIQAGCVHCGGIRMMTYAGMVHIGRLGHQEREELRAERAKSQSGE